MGDPTLPTEVKPPPPSLADKVESALMPKSPLDLALLVGAGLGEHRRRDRHGTRELTIARAEIALDFTWCPRSLASHGTATWVLSGLFAC